MLTSRVNRDARITLYGGATISLALVVLGTLTNGLISVTGWSFVLVTLGMALLFDAVAEPATA